MRFASFAAAAALSISMTLPAAAAGVTVVRGSTPHISGAHVTILRGTVPAEAMPVATREAPRGATAVAGGALLWLIDADGQVTACGVRGSSRVGAPDIVHCSAGPVVR